MAFSPDPERLGSLLLFIKHRVDNTVLIDSSMTCTSTFSPRQSAGKAYCPISLACPWTRRLLEHRSTRPLEPPGLDLPSSPYLSKTFVAYLQVSAMSTYYKTIISLVYNTFITYNILYYITRYITMIYSTVIYHVISRLYYITCDLAMLYISKFKFMLYIIQFMTCHIAY